MKCCTSKIFQYIMLLHKTLMFLYAFLTCITARLTEVWPVTAVVIDREEQRSHPPLVPAYCLVFQVSLKTCLLECDWFTGSTGRQPSPPTSGIQLGFLS